MILWNIYEKLLRCFRERRLPDRLDRPVYFCKLKMESWYYKNRKISTLQPKTGKNLYASPVNNAGKQNLANIIKKFGNEDFDYLIFVYDQTRFDEEIFNQCQFVYEKGFKWYFMKKYLPPTFCEKYDYIFPWDDDIDVADFSYKKFISIMERNDLELAQPALLPGSHYWHEITLKQNNSIGRITDCVENMVQVFTRDAWTKYWAMVEADKNFWGWGYTFMAKAICKYKKIGIIDCENVIHTRPYVRAGATHLLQAKEECDDYMSRNARRFHRSLMITYGRLA